MPPAAVAFDVNETLFSLAPLAERFDDEGLPAGTLPLWFARVLRDGFAQAATGDPADFLRLGEHHLAGLLAAAGHEATAEQVGSLLSIMKELPPQPDAEPALRRLRESGVTVVTLTNGDPDNVSDLLVRAGLDGLVSDCLGASEAGVWKPRPEPYQMAAQRCGLAPEQVALVAAHSWDVHGAKRAGLVGGFVRRLEGRYGSGFVAPDVEADDLVGVVEGLLSLT